MFVHDYHYFHMPHGMYNDINITNFEIGDSFHNANFNIVVRFDNEWFEWCRRTFENMGIDTQRHKFAHLYHWDISKTSAKLFYGKECLYDYPKPYLLLAYLGWHIAGKAR